LTARASRAARPFDPARGRPEPVEGRRIPSITWLSRLGIILCATGAAAACAPKTLKLPDGPSTPLADPSAIVQEAFGHCARVHLLTLEIGLSGKVGTTRLRGRLQAGFRAPDAIRLEAVAPFGAPFFILAGSDDKATLLLPRDERVLTGAKPSAVIQALTGLDLSPADLRAWLVGCPAPTLDVKGARAFGEQWAAIDMAGGRVAFVRRTDRWRLAGETTGQLSIEFVDHAGVQPQRVRIRHDATGATPAVDARLALSQVETNVDLPEAAFTVNVPQNAVPITVEELRSAGPLREIR
jgi:Outer membrane lipoprotein LolB